MTNVSGCHIIVTSSQKVEHLKPRKEMAIMVKDMDTLIKTEDKPEVDNITKLIKKMNDSELNKMFIFMQGVKFAETLNAHPVTNR